MTTTIPTTYFPATIALLLASILVLTSTAPPPSPPPPPPGGCTDELIAFMPCIPYISTPPNNLSDSPSSQCCNAFASAFDKDADCLCYLLRRTQFFGFPLNSSRIISLSSFCPLRDAGSRTNSSLEFICSGSSTLPPLGSITGSGLSLPHHSGQDNSPPPLTNSPPQSAADSLTPISADNSSPTQPRSMMPARSSSASKHINSRSWFPLRIMILIVSIFSCL